MDIDALLAETQAQVAELAGNELQWVAGQVVGSTRLIVLIRAWTTESILGYTWLVDEQLRDNDPMPSTEKLAGWFRHEMIEPVADGFLLDVDWADGLISDPLSVIWINPDIDSEWEHVVRRATAVPSPDAKRLWGSDPATS